MTKGKPVHRGRLAAAGLLTTIVIASGSIAVYAQGAGLVWDPGTLPETKGTVRQYTLTPRGDVDGLILVDGTEVKLPPHLTGQVVFAVKPGDAVTVHGMKARALPLIDGALVRNDATGATIVDAGPPDRTGEETTLTGRVAMALHGKRGEVNGALLENGTSLRLPPPEAARWSAFLQPNQTVTIRGVATRSALGTVVDVTALGPSQDRMTELDQRTPKAPRPPGPRERDGFGPPGGAPPPDPTAPPAPRG